MAFFTFALVFIGSYLAGTVLAQILTTRTVRIILIMLLFILLGLLGLAVTQS